MSEEVLVLGNGISRLGYDELIRAWPGEVWASNRAYLDYPDKLTRLTGHTEVLVEAVAYKGQHPGARYEIWAGHVGKPMPGAHPFTCPARFRTDSGSTLIAQALEEGYAVVACGYDLGGPDIHSPGLEDHNKDEWVKRWRAIAAHYSLDRVRFVGHDHRAYILSDRPPNEYAQDYLAGYPHIDDPEYLATWERWAGRSAIPKGGSTVVRVKFPNGYEGDMRENIALAMEKKKQLVILKPEAKKPIEPAKKPEAKA